MGFGHRAVCYQSLPSGVYATPSVLVAVKSVVALISGLERLSSLTFVLRLDGLSPIGVWDVLGGGTMGLGLVNLKE